VIEDLCEKMAKDPFDPSLMEDFDENDKTNNTRNSTSSSFFSVLFSVSNIEELSSLTFSYLQFRKSIEELRSFMPERNDKTVLMSRSITSHNNNNNNSSGNDESQSDSMMRSSSETIPQESKTAR
jgi:hypothetical protein